MDSAPQSWASGRGAALINRWQYLQANDPFDRPLCRVVALELCVPDHIQRVAPRMANHLSRFLSHVDSVLAPIADSLDEVERGTTLWDLPVEEMVPISFTVDEAKAVLRVCRADEESAEFIAAEDQLSAIPGMNYGRSEEIAFALSELGLELY